MKGGKGKKKEVEQEVQSDEEMKAIENEIKEAEARVKVANDVLKFLQGRLEKKRKLSK